MEKRKPPNEVAFPEKVLRWVCEQIFRASILLNPKFSYNGDLYRGTYGSTI